MDSVLEKLNKVLALEKEKGFQDSAVIGGLERFLAHWREEAAEQSLDDGLVEDVCSLLEGYGRLGRDEQAAAISRARARIGEEKKEAQPTARPASRQGQLLLRREHAFPEALELPVLELYGVSGVYAKRLERLGVNTIRDLLYLFPRRYQDWSDLKSINELGYGEEVTIVGTVWQTTSRGTRRGGTVQTSIIGDSTGTIPATWFNQPYLVKSLPAGKQVVLSGKVDIYLGHLVLMPEEWEPLEEELVHTGRLVPIYPLTQGIYARWLRRTLKRAVDNLAGKVPDLLPAEVRERLGLLDLSAAIAQMHFPSGWDTLRQARRRLAFDEFLLIQLGVLRRRVEWKAQPGRALQVDRSLVDHLVGSLPFPLTNAQRRALGEILRDMSQPRPMSRLLQGDVGSGKTVVALLAMLVAVANGLQAALMAPTEILAEQHYATIGRFLEGLKESLSASGIDEPVVRLLTSSIRGAERREIYEELATGEADIVIGTHALLEEGVEFKDLGLAIVDEQHRFGVSQRAILRQKGFYPEMLVMSATPIPRSLALTIYGDLDISVIDEFPPGRQGILTKWLLPRERERAYSFVRRQVEQGHQAFIICPLIEESERVEARAAVSEYQRLQQEVFPDLRLGLLHGRLRSKEKEETMGQFYRGELDILVSTPVVEVGIDVPNATVMLVEGADRFGLSQLHQFRGRVGRGEHQSYCLLLSDSPAPEGEQRLKAIESTQDGFKLAEEDLKMRGPGEFFGLRQSGLPNLRVARLGDMGTLELARQEAARLLDRDPQLAQPEHGLLAKALESFWQEGAGDLS